MEDCDARSNLYVKNYNWCGNTSQVMGKWASMKGSDYILTWERRKERQKNEFVRKKVEICFIPDFLLDF